MALCLPAAIEAALGAPPPSPPLVALRYRGAAVLVQDKASASDIDGEENYIDTGSFILNGLVSSSIFDNNCLAILKDDGTWPLAPPE